MSEASELYRQVLAVRASAEALVMSCAQMARGIKKFLDSEELQNLEKDGFFTTSASASTSTPTATVPTETEGETERILCRHPPRFRRSTAVMGHATRAMCTACGEEREVW